MWKYYHQSQSQSHQKITEQIHQLQILFHLHLLKTLLVKIAVVEAVIEVVEVDQCPVEMRVVVVVSVEKN
jgi:hypothetical protein